MTRAKMEALVEFWQGSGWYPTPSLKSAISALAQLLEQTRWRKVSEELPKNYHLCLVKRVHDPIEVSQRAQGMWAWHDRKLEDVTHWLPIQDPESEE